MVKIARPPAPALTAIIVMFAVEVVVVDIEEDVDCSDIAVPVFG